jgi:hypothetical protein
LVGDSLLSRVQDHSPCVQQMDQINAQKHM